MTALARLAPQLGNVMVRVAVALAMLFFLAQTAFHNFDTFFNEQLQTGGSFSAFDGRTAVVGNELDRLGSEYRFLAAAVFQGPSLRFLYPEQEQGRHFSLDPVRDFPFSISRPTGVFLDDSKGPYFRWLQTLYPNAEYRETEIPGGGIAVYHVVLSEEDIDAWRGLDAAYRGASGSTLTRREPSLEFNWTAETPLAMPFDARWTGILKVTEYGRHDLVLDVPGSAQILLNGDVLAEGEGQVTASPTLYRGDHLLEVAATITEPGSVSLRDGEMPVPESAYFVGEERNGLLATFFPNYEWEGEPVLVQLDPLVGYRYENELDFGSPFSAVWSGRLSVPETGTYQFEVDARTEALLRIDGVDNASSADDSAQQTIELSAGSHEIEVRFRNQDGFSRIFLYWTTPDGHREVIPPQYLSPPGSG